MLCSAYCNFQVLREEFQPARFSFNYPDPKVFYECQWRVPHTVYVLIRFALFLYSLFGLLYFALELSDTMMKYFTIWSYIVLMFHLGMAAFLSLLHYISRQNHTITPTYKISYTLPTPSSSTLDTTTTTNKNANRNYTSHNTNHNHNQQQQQLQQKQLYGHIIRPDTDKSQPSLLGVWSTSSSPSSSSPSSHNPSTNNNATTTTTTNQHHQHLHHSQSQRTKSSSSKHGIDNECMDLELREVTVKSPRIPADKTTENTLSTVTKDTINTNTHNNNDNNNTNDGDNNDTNIIIAPQDKNNEKNHNHNSIKSDDIDSCQYHVNVHDDNVDSCQYHVNVHDDNVDSYQYHVHVPDDNVDSCQYHVHIHDDYVDSCQYHAHVHDDNVDHLSHSSTSNDAVDDGRQHRAVRFMSNKPSAISEIITRDIANPSLTCHFSSVYTLPNANVQRSPFYIKLSWILATVSSVCAPVVTSIYFTSIYPNSDQAGRIGIHDLNIHILNSVFVLVDHALSARPVRILHAYVGVIFGGLYVVFSVIFWSFDHVDNVVYDIMDWNYPGPAAAVCVGLVFLFCLVQVGFFFIFRLKLCLAYSYTIHVRQTC